MPAVSPDSEEVAAKKDKVQLDNMMETQDNRKPGETKTEVNKEDKSGL